MAITVNSHEYTVFGNKAVVIADISLDSTYGYGGESLNIDENFGLHDIDFAVAESKNGYQFNYDAANDKLKVYGTAPPIVYEEVHTVSDDVITTNFPAAFIINVAISGQNKKLRSTGISASTLGDNEVSLVAQMAAGERTQITVKDWDRLAGDGAFTGGTTNWTFNAAPWTYGTNNLEKDADGTNALTHDNFAAVADRTYRLSLTLAKQGANSDVIGTITPTLGGTAGAASTATAGTYTWEITAATTDGLSLAPSNAARFVIDSITIYDLSEPVYITYVTQAWGDVWDNLVQDESITLATGANTLDSGNKIAAVMYIDQTTTTAAALAFIDEDDTVASGEVDLKLNSATDQFTVHSGQNAKAVKTTYIKVPSSGFIADRVFTNESATKAGGDPYTNTSQYPILLWAYTGQAPVNGQTTLRLIDYAGTPASGEAVFDWYYTAARGAGAPVGGSVIGVKDNFTTTMAGVWGTVNEIENLRPLEVRDGVDLSGVENIKLLLIGT